MRRYRIETDALGSVRVPADRYCGIRTQRAQEAVASSGLYLPRRFHWALGLVKRSCCEANEALELLDVARAEWIATAAQEVMDGKFDAEFPLDVLQAGSGAATNSNANEVIANRAIELMGGELGSGDPVDPGSHVDLNQSAFGVMVSAVQIAAAVALERDLLPALRTLRDSLEGKAAAHPPLAAHLRSCTPPVTQGLQLAEQARDRLLPLVLGRTAAGASPGRAGEFPRLAIERIADEAEVPFRAAGPGAPALDPRDAVIAISDCLKAVAGSLFPVAKSLRRLNADLALAGAVQATHGNTETVPLSADPSPCEVLTVVCGKVMGNDSAIRLGEHDEAPETPPPLPLLAHAILQSIALLSTGCTHAAHHGVAPLEPAPGASPSP